MKCFQFFLQSVLPAPWLTPLTREEPAKRTLLFVFMICDCLFLVYVFSDIVKMFFFFFFRFSSLFSLFTPELEARIFSGFGFPYRCVNAGHGLNATPGHVFVCCFYQWQWSLLASLHWLEPFVWVLSGLLDLLCRDAPVFDLSSFLCSSAAPHSMTWWMQQLCYVVLFWPSELFGSWPKVNISGRPTRSSNCDCMYRGTPACNARLYCEMHFL